ncbi:MAG: EamA family transporter [Arcanobacterium sp.]|nr:EamA family transporter [Arcanobacterium sp.]
MAESSRSGLIFGGFAPFALILAAIFQYFGAGLAVQLFDELAIGTVAWGRIAASAILLMLIVRPRIRKMSFLNILIFGLTLTGMNLSFYYSIAYLPLGAAVSIEFLGPVLLSVFSSSGIRPRIALLLAFTGVLLISWVGFDLSDSKVQYGLLMSAIAGGLWAFYIWLGNRAVQQGSGPETLATGMMIGAIVFLPFALPELPQVATNWYFILLLFLVGFFASVLPYIIEFSVLRYVPTWMFSLLMALYPAASLGIGVVMLGQIPTFGEVSGLICITAAVVLISEKTKDAV